MPATHPRTLVRCCATVEIVDGVPAEYITAAAKVMDADQIAIFEANVGSMYPQMARISIEPTWARFFDFGAGRFPAFLRQLAEEAAGSGSTS